MTATKPNFFAKMKDLSEKEQNMQMKLLQGSQLLEEVSIKRSKEEKRLEEARSKKLRAAQNKFSMLKDRVSEVQRKKQDLLRSSWNIPLPPSAPSQQSMMIEGILPLVSTSNAVPDSSKSVDSYRASNEQMKAEKCMKT
ncbi:hypothetical protein GBAR_LOCUS28374 [Geodia barretti]|uniref:Uncharacterized protein n=1 Tax=Geodia barretti TaxID=519541 RepID=A0AA35XIA9_GEOBA|nr:hypothetical protein GBAR_LOCUS28374 [Geodia barretti]